MTPGSRDEVAGIPVWVKKWLPTSADARDADADQQLNELAYKAAAIARAISLHHQECGKCKRGGELVIGAGGLRRVPCPAELELFRQLHNPAPVGWEQ